MADFNIYFPIEESLEGTVFENDSNDNGGATKFGLTISDLQEYNLDENSDGVIDWKDIQSLNVQDAAKVLKKVYWDYFKADTIVNQSMGMFLVDGGLNQGKVLISKYLQLCLGVTVDGMPGVKTIAALNNYPNQQDLFNQIYNKRKQHYDNIIAANPSQEVYRKGWYNRLNAITFKP